MVSQKLKPVFCAKVEIHKMEDCTKHNLDVPSYQRWALILIVGLGLLRLLYLPLVPLNLHGDEAQYWAWSRKLDWGYFSKPPMIAWLIAFFTGVLGNAEWVVRLFSPLIHPLIALVLFLTARKLFDARTGFWSVCFYFLMPAVWLSSIIASTDVPLLLCWALSLFFWVNLRETRKLRWAALLGAGIGFGFLSKYVMLFFLPALATCMVFDRPTRTALLSRNGLLTALLTALIIAPNILWNANNNFATFDHTVANANIKGVPFHPLELLAFWGKQFAVFGMLTLPVLIMAFRPAGRRWKDKRTLCLAFFILCPLLIISLEALLSRANANWAATAYAGGAILAAHAVTTGSPKLVKFAKTGIWFNVFLGSISALILLSPQLVNTFGMANSVKRLRGWPETVATVSQYAQSGHQGKTFTAVATDNRLVFYDLYYYGIENRTGLPLRMWLHTARANNHAEATAPLTPSSAQDSPVLFLNYYRNYGEKLREDFARIYELQPIEIDLGGGKIRNLKVWAGYGYTPTDKQAR